MQGKQTLKKQNLEKVTESTKTFYAIFKQLSSLYAKHVNVFMKFLKRIIVVMALREDLHPCPFLLKLNQQDYLQLAKQFRIAVSLEHLQ